MKFCFKSAWFIACVLAAIAACAFRRLECAGALDQLGVEIGGVDPCKELSGLTVSPSRTVIWRTSPDTLALTVA
jgi:hypothetical protein